MTLAPGWTTRLTGKNQNKNAIADLALKLVLRNKYFIIQNPNEALYCSSKRRSRTLGIMLYAYYVSYIQ